MTSIVLQGRMMEKMLPERINSFILTSQYDGNRTPKKVNRDLTLRKEYEQSATSQDDGEFTPRQDGEGASRQNE